MSYIVDFFSALADVSTAIIEFIVDLFTGLVGFFTQIPEYVDTLEGYIDLLPSPVLPIALMVLAAQLIFIIIGRRGV